jgi:transposase
MDKESFKKWVSEKLIPMLEEPSLINMDNASYHSSLIEKLPNASWKKSDLQEWLRAKKIIFDDDSGKTELLSLCRQNKPQNTRYVIDELLQEHGHQVLRLPPYHCQYNPIELVWGISKQYYDRHIGEHGRGDETVKKVWGDALAEATPAVWASCVNHTEKLIQDDWAKMVTYDENESRIIIDLAEDSNDEDSSSEDAD